MKYVQFTLQQRKPNSCFVKPREPYDKVIYQFLYLSKCLMDAGSNMFEVQFRSAPVAVAKRQFHFLNRETSDTISDKSEFLSPKFSV